MPALVAIVCAECGGTFQRRATQKFCSKQCASKNRKKAQTTIQQALWNKIFELHTEKGFSNRRIARELAIAPQTVRTALEKRGIKTDPQKIKASGENRATRKIECRKVQRLIVAKCLHGLRKGIGIETTLRSLDVQASTAWNWLYKNKSYKRLTERRTTKKPQIWRCFKSKSFKNEAEFQGECERVIKVTGIPYKREARIEDSRSRVDFVVSGAPVECKIVVRSGEIYQAIGQVLHYRTRFTPIPILLIPDDVRIRADLLALFDKVPARVMCLSEFRSFLNGNAIVKTEKAIEQKTSAFRCKICGSTTQRRSRTKSHWRSYCVDCEGKAKTMRWDAGVRRWVRRTESCDVVQEFNFSESVENNQLKVVEHACYPPAKASIFTGPDR